MAPLLHDSLMARAGLAIASGTPSSARRHHLLAPDASIRAHPRRSRRVVPVRAGSAALIVMAGCGSGCRGAGIGPAVLSRDAGWNPLGVCHCGLPDTVEHAVETTRDSEVLRQLLIASETGRAWRMFRYRCKNSHYMPDESNVPESAARSGWQGRPTSRPKVLARARRSSAQRCNHRPFPVRAGVRAAVSGVRKSIANERSPVRNGGQRPEGGRRETQP